MRSMQAAVLAGPERFELHAVPVPDPGPGEVRLRLDGCGVCASNITPWEGPEWMRFPAAPGELGHEGWGIVDALGDGVTGWREGDRVAGLGTRSFAEYDCLPAGTLVSLPPELAGLPVPAEALGCGFNIFRRSDVGAGQAVAIIGIGFLGAILCRLASDAGARVIAISRRPESLDLARAMGATEALPMLDHHAILDQVHSLTGGRGCERVIECVGKQWPLDLAGAITATGGRLVIAGYHQDGPRQVDMQMWNWKGIDIASAHERDPAVARRGIVEALAAIAQGRLRLDRLVTHRYRLADVGEAIRATRDKPPGFVKAVVEIA